ncbi:MAG: gliding motility lipoprotein GldH [Sphingomonadales bacterium]|nr:gliding motility lipoprotein GldH [Sphingomonadales bacterium]
MGRRLIILFWIISGVVLFSCSDSAELDVFLDVKGAKWAYSDVKVIEWECKDTATRYDLLLNIRHKGNYEWQNIYLKVRLADPSGKEREFLRSAALSDAEGYWLGKGLGDWKVASPVLVPGLRCTKLGLYRIQLEQHMRVDPLEGVGQVGLKIVKRTAIDAPK